MLGIARQLPLVRGFAAPNWLPSADGKTPALYADFANGRYYYNGRLYVSFATWLAAVSGTFTRASSAYYTTSAGLLASASTDVLRFDYDPVTLLPNGILLEAARTNVLLYSSDLTNAAWSKAGVTITAAATTAPDGTTTGQKFENTSAGVFTSFAFQTVTVTADANYPGSVYLKYFDTRWVFILIYNGGNQAGFWFDLLNGVVGSSITAAGTGAAVSIAIENAGNGWYRCKAVANVGSGATAINFLTSTASADSSTTSALGSFYQWGAQFENNVSFASSYIPTTTGSVARAADSLTAAMSALTAGAIYARARTPNIATAQRIFQIDDASANNRASLSFNASAAGAFDLLDATVSQAALTAGTITANAASKLAATFAAGDYALVVGGGAAATDASGTVPAGLATIRFGADSAGANNLFGNIAELAVWNSRVSNVELQRLSTP